MSASRLVTCLGVIYVVIASNIAGCHPRRTDAASPVASALDAGRPFVTSAFNRADAKSKSEPKNKNGQNESIVIAQDGQKYGLVIRRYIERAVVPGLDTQRLILQDAEKHS